MLNIIDCMHRQKSTCALKLAKTKHDSLLRMQPSRKFCLERISVLECTADHFEVFMITTFMTKL